jgi:D-amino peptidase
VLLVTGDQAVCREGAELLGSGLTTVAVKEGLGRFSARQVPPLRAREMIENGARRALQDLSAVKPYDPGRPAEITIEFTTPDRLVEYRNRRATEQVDDHTLVVRGDDWWTAWSQFYF